MHNIPDPVILHQSDELSLAPSTHRINNYNHLP
jgi:hypothetical protein